MKKKVASLCSKVGRLETEEGGGGEGCGGRIAREGKGAFSPEVFVFKLICISLRLFPLEGGGEAKGCESSSE